MSDETTACHEDRSPVFWGFFLSEILLLTLHVTAVGFTTILK